MITTTAIFQSRILIVDDQKVNLLLLEHALRSAGYEAISSTPDPSQVCALYIQHRYDLILLDLQMPIMDGFQVLEELKKIKPDDYLPVLVVTAQPGHKLRALQAGAKDFISKPFELAELLARVHNLLEVRLLHQALRQYNDGLEQQVRARIADLQENYLETIFTLTRAAEHKDEAVGIHVQRISYYNRELARQLGLDEAFVDQLFFASPMHDIGKIGIPDAVLLKPGSLTPEEWKIMQGHTVMGAKILGNSQSPYLKLGAEIALNHHERWDGGGYPNGKRGEAIPLAARLTHISDIYDALRSKRPYKLAFDHQQAVDIMTRGDGRTQPEHFDPAILAAFQKIHGLFRDIFETYTA